MDSGMENSDPHSPSIRSPTDQSPLQKNSFEERSSDDEEKQLEEEVKTSSQLRENGTQRGGSEPKTDEENNCKKSELNGRNWCNQSEAESRSSQESSTKRKRGSRDSLCDRTGTSPEEKCRVTLEERGKVSNAGHSSYSKETEDACRRRAQRRRTGHSKQPRSRSSGVQPPLLRKSLVNSLRTMSEATYQTIVQMQNQEAPCPLSWEHYALLAQLRRQLYTQVQTIYAMATQAAYVFPAEGWLSPAPVLDPWGPVGDGGEAQNSSSEGYLGECDSCHAGDGRGCQ